MQLGEGWLRGNSRLSLWTASAASAGVCGGKAWLGHEPPSLLPGASPTTPSVAFVDFVNGQGASYSERTAVVLDPDAERLVAVRGPLLVQVRIGEGEGKGEGEVDRGVPPDLARLGQVEWALALGDVRGSLRLVRLSASLVVLLHYDAARSSTTLTMVDRKSGNVTGTESLGASWATVPLDQCVHVHNSTVVLVRFDNAGGDQQQRVVMVLVDGASGEQTSEHVVPFDSLPCHHTTTRGRVCTGPQGAAWLLLSSWNDMRVKIMSLDTGELVRELVSTNRASVKSIAANDKFIAVGYEWQRFVKHPPLVVHSATDGAQLHKLASGASVERLEIAGDSLLFSLQSNAKEVRVWDMEAGTRLYSLKHPREKISSFSLSLPHHLCITTGREVGVWDFSPSPPTPHASNVGVVVLVDGKDSKPKKRRRGELE